MRLPVALFVALIPTLVAAMPARAQTVSADGSGCEDVIGRWRDFAAKENQGGHMDSSVYDKIQTEIDQATDLCRAGQDARASKMIEASMRRHGY